jgi:hypothetical protein
MLKTNKIKYEKEEPIYKKENNLQDTITELLEELLNNYNDFKKYLNTVLAIHNEYISENIYIVSQERYKKFNTNNTDKMNTIKEFTKDYIYTTYQDNLYNNIKKDTDIINILYKSIIDKFTSQEYILDLYDNYEK